MYKKHSSFSFIALLFVPRLSEHEPPGARYWNVKSWIACFLASPDIIIAFLQLYSTSEIVTRLL